MTDEETAFDHGTASIALDQLLLGVDSRQFENPDFCSNLLGQEEGVDDVAVSTSVCAAFSGRVGLRKVATTKTLHWLFPDLFTIIDRNVAWTFRDYFGVKFRKSTQPGYSAERYMQCLHLVQDDIRSFGPQPFSLLEENAPEARIFDKIAWAPGKP